MPANEDKFPATRRLMAAGLLTALGLILPYVTSHMFGVPGTVFLPMHLPVLLCGLLCGPEYGSLCGIVVPVVSCLLTGMPLAYPMLPIMLATLAGLGLVGGLAYRRLRLPVFPAAALALVCGWALYGLTFQALFLAGGGSLRALTLTAALVTGAPGLAILLFGAPFLTRQLEKTVFLAGGRVAREVQPDGRPVHRDPLGKEESPVGLPGVPTALLEQARGLIQQEGVSCVLLRSGEIIHTADGRGVAPLLTLYEGAKEKLAGSCVVDRIIGKAAAMILVLGGVSAVYGDVMSQAACDYLTARHIPVQYGRCVGVITGRTGSGICPIESSVLAIDDPEAGLAALTQRLVELRRSAG